MEIYHDHAHVTRAACFSRLGILEISLGKENRHGDSPRCYFPFFEEDSPRDVI